MPRKTSAPVIRILATAPSFNEAAARCRGKRAAGGAKLIRHPPLQ